METQTINNEINQTLEKIYEFIKDNKKINEDFVEYTKTMGIYGTHDSKMKEYYTPYIFERSIPDMHKNPIMLFNETDGNELSNSMEKAFTSIFQIKKLMKNGFEAYNLINEKNYTLNVTSKMTDYRGYGNGQFIVARIFEFKNEFYIIEMLGTFPSSKSEDAMRYAMAKIIQEPYLVYENNPKKEAELEENINFMYDKFMEAFGTDEIITTSKFADEIIGQFNDFVENGTAVDIQDKLELPETLEYFEVSDFNNDYDNFVEKSLSGFSSHKKTYDTGIIYDKDYGLYVIPFYKTLLTILEQNSTEHINGAKECLEYFITSPTVSPNIIKRIYKKYPNFLDLANDLKNENLTLEELFVKYKYEYVTHKIFSQTTILYNSKVFTNTIGIVAENEEHANIDYSNAKRNDPCPCGSGKKYKNCCLKG
ncbi:SEC-C domain-containing protein [bacterium]|nr:SEC-C domain-containing protein [bacterium]